jgi:gamma-glutamylputrescine oxidase
VKKSTKKLPPADVVAEHVDSHYARTLRERMVFGTAEGRIETEICVIGAGLAGLATALDLAERGHDVVVLEANRVGWGASGRNGGFASPGFPQGAPALVARIGMDDARELMALSIAGHNLLRARIDRYAIDCGPIEPGALRCAMADATESLERFTEQMARDFGLAYHYWPRERLRAHLATCQYSDAFLNTHSFTVHPLNLARGLARAVTEQGGSVFEASRVTATRLDRARKRLTTARATIDCDHVVFACGGYVGGLNWKIGMATIPIATFVMVTEPLGDRLDQAISVRHAISDIKHATNYYRRLDDGRLLWGGRVLAWEPAASRIADRLRHDMAQFYPDLASARVERAWGGKMPYLAHRTPVVDQISPGVWTATGFGGLGVSLTTTAGRMIGAAIGQRDDRFRLLARFGLPFAGGHLGRVPAQAVYWRHAAEAAWSRHR